MLRFYWRLLRRVPVEAQAIWDTVVFRIGVVFSLLLLFNQEAGRRITETWAGASRLWAVVPLAIAVIYQVARRNYEEFERLRLRVETEEGRKARRTVIRNGLGRLVAECKFYENHCYGKSDPVELEVNVRRVVSSATSCTHMNHICSGYAYYGPSAS